MSGTPELLTNIVLKLLLLVNSASGVDGNAVPGTTVATFDIAAKARAGLH